MEEKRQPTIVFTIRKDGVTEFSFAGEKVMEFPEGISFEEMERRLREWKSDIERKAAGLPEVERSGKPCCGD